MSSTREGLISCYDRPLLRNRHRFESRCKPICSHDPAAERFMCSSSSGSLGCQSLLYRHHESTSVDRSGRCGVKPEYGSQIFVYLGRCHNVMARHMAVPLKKVHAFQVHYHPDADGSLAYSGLAGTCRWLRKQCECSPREQQRCSGHHNHGRYPTEQWGLQAVSSGCCNTHSLCSCVKI